MKLMALVMISRIGSEVLIGLANDSRDRRPVQTALAIAGIAVVVFIIAMYVPNIMQGVVQGRLGHRRHGDHPSRRAGCVLRRRRRLPCGWRGGCRICRSTGGTRRRLVRGCCSSRIGAGFGAGAKAAGSAAKEKAIGSPGAYAGSILGLANAKLDERLVAGSEPNPVNRRNATTNRKFKKGKRYGRNAPPKTRTLPPGRNGPNDTAPMS
jgi:type IV secretion system protein TrbL